MAGMIYLRCFGAGSIIEEIDLESLHSKTMSEAFYRKGEVLISGVCNVSMDKGEKRLRGIFVKDGRMFCVINDLKIDLFDESYTVSRDMGIFRSTVSLFNNGEEFLELTYKSVSEDEDVFSYVEDALSNTPRKITMNEYTL